MKFFKILIFYLSLSYFNATGEILCRLRSTNQNQENLLIKSKQT